MKVSVHMLTYNHEKFIAQAIDSVLMQQVNFDYEIVIGEDCSTDETRDIVIDYQKRYPNKIRLLLQDKNVGSIKNLIEVYKLCQGEYIPFLDGDDYWTSPYKLQKQVDFLDNHPECAMCFHNALVFYEDGIRDPYYCNPVGQKEISSLEDLLTGNFITGCSAMFRRHIFMQFPDWFYSVKLSDWALYILSAQHGKIGYIDEVMGAYRKHAGGAYSSSTRINKLESRIEMYKTINTHFDFKYNKTVKASVSKCYCDLALEYAQVGDLSKARRYFKKSVLKSPFNKRIPPRKLFECLLRVYAPPLYKLIRTLIRSNRLIPTVKNPIAR